jgi:hypothetical protein
MGRRLMVFRDADGTEREIGPDTMLRLEIAAHLAFPDGSLKASGLRAEAKRGRLKIMRIAGKDFTTLAAIERMGEQCLVPTKDQGSGLSQKNATPTGSSFGAPRGSSETDREKSALAALEMTAKQLSAPSATTLRKSTRSRGSAVVTRLRSS